MRSVAAPRRPHIRVFSHKRAKAAGKREKKQRANAKKWQIDSFGIVQNVLTVPVAEIKEKKELTAEQKAERQKRKAQKEAVKKAEIAKLSAEKQQREEEKKRKQEENKVAREKKNEEKRAKEQQIEKERAQAEEQQKAAKASEHKQREEEAQQKKADKKAADAEKQAKAAAEKVEKEKLQKEKAAKDAAAKQEKERLAKEKAEKDAIEKAEKDRLAKEKAEKDAAEKAEKEAAKKAEKEKQAKEKAEKEAAEKAEKERVAKEKAEKQAAEKAEKERIAKEKAEKAAAEKAEKERIAKEKADEEARAAAAKAEEDRLAQEKAASEAAAQAERERIEKEKAEAEQNASQGVEEELIPKTAVYGLNAEQHEGGKKKNKKGKKGDAPQTVVDDDAHVHEHISEVKSVSQNDSAPVESTSGKKNKKNKKGGQTANDNPEVVVLPNGSEAVVEHEYSATSVVTNGTGLQSNGKSAFSPPIQVHEISSSEEPAAGESTTTVLTAMKEMDAPPTQFAQEVEKLVSQTLGPVDDTVKVTIEAQLLKLQNQAKPVIEHKPLVLAINNHHVLSRPTTPSRSVELSPPTSLISSSTTHSPSSRLRTSQTGTPNSERMYKLLPKDIIFCSSLLEKHGENFDAMAKDEINVYKESASALRRKIRVFKESPHFAVIERAKQEGKTVAQIVEENPE